MNIYTVTADNRTLFITDSKYRAEKHLIETSYSCAVKMSALTSDKVELSDDFYKKINK